MSGPSLDDPRARLRRAGRPPDTDSSTQEISHGSTVARYLTRVLPLVRRENAHWQAQLGGLQTRRFARTRWLA